MKSGLVREAEGILEGSGYRVLDCSGLRSCFDLLARRDKTLVIKVLANIDGLTRRCCLELQNVALVTSSIPLVLGDHTKSAKLAGGVVYERYGVHVLNKDTLGDVINDDLPVVYSVRGNYCVRIDSRVLARVRRKLNLTQEGLAKHLGVSKQSIHRYESLGRVSLEVIDRLIDFLEDNIVLPSEVFSSQHVSHSFSESRPSSLKRLVLEKFLELGFSASLTNAPFDVVAVEGDERVLTSVSDDPRRLRLRVEVISDVSNMLGSYGVCVSNRCEESDVVILKPRQLSGIRDSRELLDLLAGS
ncbi:MAG: helix-turn-helix domain-containing protein [Candidatus Altiarchaeota archaeon]|nr:helix-turn-helix domain-containing protein [Candidatus Altiarchaeota archaeon]